MKDTYDPSKLNELLARLGVLMKKTRTGFWAENTYGVRFSQPFHHGKPEAGVWFRTRGCGHDRVGGCVMCDYGAGPDSTSSEDMIEYVSQGMQTLPKQLYHVLVSPLGSFLDEWEVPEAARVGILSLLHRTDHETFSFESRAETISEDIIAETCGLLDHRPLKVYMGLESANPWISKYCINKALSLESFDRAVAILRRKGVSSIANVLLGAPFLSVQEQIEDSIQSVHWGLAKGAYECCLFPTHVKKWTSLVWFYNKGLYSPPSLWSYIEVLHRLGPEIAEKIELSWYSSRKYKDPNLVSSPTTCDVCYDRVIGYLDEFDESADFECIEKLASLECSCKNVWREALNAPSYVSPVERVIRAYDRLGGELFSSWWQINRARVVQGVSTEALALQNHP